MMRIRVGTNSQKKFCAPLRAAVGSTISYSGGIGPPLVDDFMVYGYY